MANSPFFEPAEKQLASAFPPASSSLFSSFLLSTGDPPLPIHRQQVSLLARAPTTSLFLIKLPLHLRDPTALYHRLMSVLSQHPEDILSATYIPSQPERIIAEATQADSLCQLLEDTLSRSEI
jgi:hypothetical protein